MSETAGPAALGRLARRSDYTDGVLLILAGTVAFSSAGLFVRMIARDAATILFWRGLFTAFVVLAYVAWRERERTLAAFRAIGGAGLWIAALSAASMGCFIASLQYTTVANNSIIFGTAPFMTALIAWIAIRERPSAATVACSLAALAGALVVLGSSFSLSAATLWGDLLAVAMTLAFAIKTVLIRRHRDVPMVPSACVGALIGSLGAAPFVDPLDITPAELGWFALFGLTQQGLGLILSTLGAARIPAAHSALIMTLDLPLSPMWVWLAFAERPSLGAVIGGAVVMTAIVGHVLLESRRMRTPA